MYELQVKAFVGRNAVLSCPNLILAVEPDPARPVAVHVQYDDKAHFIAGDALSGRLACRWGLLPPVAPRTYNLRPRARNYLIPQRTSALADKNFITRMLYSGLVAC